MWLVDPGRTDDVGQDAQGLAAGASGSLSQDELEQRSASATLVTGGTVTDLCDPRVFHLRTEGGEDLMVINEALDEGVQVGEGDERRDSRRAAGDAR